MTKFKLESKHGIYLIILGILGTIFLISINRWLFLLSFYTLAFGITLALLSNVKKEHQTVFLGVILIILTLAFMFLLPERHVGMSYMLVFFGFIAGAIILITGIILEVIRRRK